MKIYRRDQVAEKTTKEVRRLLRNENRIYAYITPYNNCREIGHVLHVTGWVTNDVFLDEAAWTYSENRNSDDIVVYSGDFEKALRAMNLSRDFEVAADKMGTEAKFFRNPKEAARFIAKGVSAAIRAVIKASKNRSKKAQAAEAC